jgi:hypothetical protein
MADAREEAKEPAQRGDQPIYPQQQKKEEVAIGEQLQP